jgi:hypothetical protein
LPADSGVAPGAVWLSAVAERNWNDARPHPANGKPFGSLVPRAQFERRQSRSSIGEFHHDFVIPHRWR